MKQRESWNKSSPSDEADDDVKRDRTPPARRANLPHTRCGAEFVAGGDKTALRNDRMEHFSAKTVPTTDHVWAEQSWTFAAPHVPNPRLLQGADASSCLKALIWIHTRLDKLLLRLVRGILRYLSRCAATDESRAAWA